jgi:hypothetical protein
LRLTNFPKTGPKLLVGIETTSKLVTVIKNLHKVEKVLRRDCVINVVVVKKIICRLNEEKLKDAFDNDLLEGPPPIVDQVTWCSPRSM